MRLAAWKHFSLIMAMVLILGTGATALIPAAPVAADNALTHGKATDNVTDRHSLDLAGASENRTHRFPGLSQSGSPASGYAPAGSAIWYVNGELGTNDGSHGTGPGAAAFKTIQYALDTASSGDTIYIAGLAQYSTDSYEEGLTISKSISLVGDGPDTTELWVNEAYSTVRLTGAGLDVSISGMYIHHNNAWSINGGCISAADSTLTLNNMDLWGEGDEGGGIYVDNCTLVANDCWISGTAHNNGGGLNALDSDVTLNRCIFAGPDSGGNGGGLYAYGSEVNMTDCYFYGGEYGGAGAGGAIYVNSTVLTALRCSFCENWSDGDGGALYINAADANCTVSMSNCTFNYNYTDWGSDGYGGAIYMVSYDDMDGYTANLALTGCTFFDNEATGDGYGGGLAQEGDNCTTTISNCIFDNSAYEYDNIVRLDNAGEVADVGTINSSYSLYSDIPSGFTSEDHDITETSSLCYDMADNGGLTPTCAIDSGSRARGNGSNAGLATDQRGVARLGSANDIGAYQWVGPTYADNGKANDSGDGRSWATAKKHVYAAANLAGPGSTAFVAAGTYTEEYHDDIYEWEYYNINIDKPLTLTGAGAASTIIDDGVRLLDYGDDTIIDVYDGATDVWDEGAVSISGFTLRNAQGEYCYGGGLYIESEGVTTVRDCIVEDNYAEDGGGGVYIEDAGDVALLGCTIRNNSAYDEGGGVYIYSTDNVAISNCAIIGNAAYDDYDGGGIYASGIDTFSVASSTVDNNTASSNGGGVFLSETIEGLLIEASTLSNNRAGGCGGGLFNELTSAVQFTNCTVYGNSLDSGNGNGGGIYNVGHAELLNCTVASNDAGPSGQGGGFFEAGSYTGVFKNTILANNTAGAGHPDDIAADGDYVFVSNGHNICTTDNASEFFNQPTDNVSTNPGLGPLQDNGGPTFTCAIGATSPAFNTAQDGPATDQRGVARPQYVYYDVGAYELSQAAAPTVTAITPSTGVNTGTVNITNLAGTNFASGATARLTRSGQADIVGGSVVFVSSTKLTCTFNLTGAAAGAWNVVVTNPDTQSGTLPNGFTVTAPATAPTVTAINPDSGMWGETLSVTITGTNFTGTTAVSFGPGITVTFTVASPTQINATIHIAPGAALGARNVTVTTPQGTGTYSFTVKLNPSIAGGSQSHGGSSIAGGGSTGQGGQGLAPMSLPNIVVQSASISASKVAPGETVTITANLVNKGTVNGISAVKVYVNGQEEAVQGVTVNSGSNRPVSFTISRSEPGTYTVFVGGTQAGSFTVDSLRESDIILWLSMACVLAALVLGMIMLWRRQRNYY